MQLYHVQLNSKEHTCTKMTERRMDFCYATVPAETGITDSEINWCFGRRETPSIGWRRQRREASGETWSPQSLNTCIWIFPRTKKTKTYKKIWKFDKRHGLTLCHVTIMVVKTFKKNTSIWRNVIKKREIGHKHDWFKSCWLFLSKCLKSAIAHLISIIAAPFSPPKKFCESPKVLRKC